MIKDVMDIAERYGCNMVYLFGSKADNGRRYLEGGYVVPEPSSDLDLAVAFETPPLDVFKIYGSLYKEFSDIFEPFEVDIVFKCEIIKGVRIYEKDAIISDEFEEDVIKRAGDLVYKKRIFNKEV